MNSLEINSSEINHSTNLAPLFPEDWHFNFENFINNHYDKAYFKGYTLQFKNQNIGFGNLFIFGYSAWLGNILVHSTHRGKGYGTKITKELIKVAKKNGVETCNLIATPLGKSIYENLGFKTELNYEFYSSAQVEFNFNIDVGIRKATITDFEDIKNIDYLITGENRMEMLKFYLPNTYVALMKGNNVGFFIDALETGLIISTNKVYGIELLKTKLNKGNTKIIIPENNVSLNHFLTENGFKKKLSLPKMILGKNYNWLPENIYNRGAGYCG